MRSIGGVARNTRIALRSGRIVRTLELRSMCGSCKRSGRPLFELMENQSATVQRLGAVRRELIENSEYLLRQGVLKLLAIKDSDVRILTLEQSRDAVDKGLHAGGAFSAVIPLVTLFYGGFIELDIEDPTRRGQDIFTL